MNKAVNIIVSIFMWCLVAAYVVMATHYSRDRRADVSIKELHIAIADSTHNGIISTSMVSRWLAASGINPVGQPIDEVDTRAIERKLAAHSEIKRVNVWSNLDGILTVRVEGRTPLMRVRTAGGYRFWFTDDGYIISDKGDFSAYTPVVTGSVPFPFSPSATGSYDEMQKAVRGDFLAQFTALETERRSLASQRSSTRSSLGAVRASAPKRFWGKMRDSLFYVDKKIRISGLEKELSRIDASLADLAANRRTLMEKEKKSYESYRFLSKLANFVGFIEHNDFWAAGIVQINVVGEGSPQLELIPRTGNHTVLLGELDGTEIEKLEKLRLFYSGALWHEGWNKYRYINIKYKDQIVCTK